VARATDAVAAHSDALADRLASQESITADVTAAFGEELAQLRAEVQHLRRLVGSPDDAPGSAL
jgi:phage shock protein A